MLAYTGRRMKEGYILKLGKKDDRKPLFGCISISCICATAHVSDPPSGCYTFPTGALVASSSPLFMPEEPNFHAVIPHAEIDIVDGVHQETVAGFPEAGTNKFPCMLSSGTRAAQHHPGLFIYFSRSHKDCSTQLYGGFYELIGQGKWLWGKLNIVVGWWRPV